MGVSDRVELCVNLLYNGGYRAGYRRWSNLIFYEGHRNSRPLFFRMVASLPFSLPLEFLFSRKVVSWSTAVDTKTRRWDICTLCRVRVQFMSFPVCQRMIFISNLEM